MSEMEARANETLNVAEQSDDHVLDRSLRPDHFGDFAAYYIGGWVGGRGVPLNVWGPSGPRENLGTEYALTR